MMSPDVDVTLAGTAAVAGPRTRHVAPEALAGLPADARVHAISEASAKAWPGDTVRGRRPSPTFAVPRRP